MIKAMILAAAALTMGATTVDAQTMIEKNNIKVENHLMTPELSLIHISEPTRPY